MAATWRTVRVFISSTFRDMHAERDYLVKVVFPSLRERLEKYRIHLVDVDLRWGITEEEAQRDRVLDLCLEEIDRCRPLFVGILGKRYGWVPTSFSDEALSKYGWVQHQTGKSVTELEILYGVLRDPQMHARALFLFRDPAFIADVPEAKRADMMAEDDQSAEKLHRLKQAIREAGLPIPPLEHYPCQYAGLRINWRLARRELDEATRAALEGVAIDGIVDPQEYASIDDRLRHVVCQYGVVGLAGLDTFGREVEERLWNAIRAEHHLPEVPPVEAAAAADPLAIEQDYHERFMESRLRVYVGRESVQERLTAFAEGEATHPCLVTAPSGSGKSAALSKFATSYAEAHPDALVIPHFVGASPGSTGLRQMLRRFCLVLKDRFGLADEVPLDVNALVGRFRESLESVPGDGRVVLVIDALNQLDETDNAQSMWWLPWELPPRVKIIASCIDDPDRTEPVLEALAHRPVERVPVEPLTDDERREIIRRVPSLSAKTLDRRQVDLLLSNPATKNALFLLVALEELRGFGSFEQLEARIAAFPRPGGTGVPPVLEDSTGKMPVPPGDTVAAIFGQVIERLCEEFDDNVVRTVLALLACARSGMSERELLEMVEPEKGTGLICRNGPQGASHKLAPSPFPAESTSDLFPVLRQLRPYLQHRGEMVDFFHRGLYKAVREQYLPDDSSMGPYHQDLAGYFHAKLNPPGAQTWSGEYPHALSELPHHETQGQLWEPLEATLTALPFLEGKVTAGMAFELAGDFTAAVQALPADRPGRRTLQLLEEALRRDIQFIARHAEDYPQGLFQCLWNTCWWYDCDEAAGHYESGRPPGLPSPACEKGAGGEGTTPAVPLAGEGLSGTGVIVVSMDGVTPATPLTGEDLGGTGVRGVGIHGTTSPLPLAGEASGEGSQPPSPQPHHHRLSRLLEHWRTYKDHASPGFPWLASHRPPPIHLGTAQKAVFRGHEDSVNSVSYSPDGRRFASGSGDHTLRVWDAESGAELAVLRGHEDSVTSVSYSPDGRRIVSGSWDKTLRMWDAESGAELAVLRGHEGRVDSVSYSPDGRRIVSGSMDNTVRVWDAESGAELALLRGHKGGVESVSYSPDGRRIVSGGGDRDNTVRVWDAESGAELAVLRGHEDWVNTVSYSPDGRRIVSGSRDHTVRVWDAESGAELALLCGHDLSVASVSYSPDGRRIVSGASDQTLRVWDAESRAELALLRGHITKVTSVSYSPDGRRIASGSGDHTLRVWDAESGAELALWRGHVMEVTSVSYSPDGRRIASGSEDHSVRVWDAESGAELALLRGHKGGVESVSYSPDGRRIVSGGGYKDNTVRVWDAESGAELAVLRGHENQVRSVSYSPDGRRIVSGAGGVSGPRDNTVRVWDAESGAELALLRGQEEWVKSVSYSPDGRRIVSGAGNFLGGGDDTVRVWDAETGECLEVIRGSGDVGAIAAAGSSGLPWRAIGREGELVIEPTGGGESLARFPEALHCITTHPDGRTWAGSFGNHVCIISLEGDPSPPPRERGG